MIKSIRFNRIVVILVVFMVITPACSLTAPPISTPGNKQAPSPTSTVFGPTEESPPLPTSSPASDTASNLVISELDPCKLVTKASAEAALGQAVDEPIIAQDATVQSCTYIAVPGERLVTATVYTGDNAKNYLLNEIAQLKNGCDLSFSASTHPEQPTPFPPEVETLRSTSIQDLFLMDLVTREGCGLSYSQVTNLGDNAYTFQSFFVGAVIGVATEDAFVVFVVGDVSVSPEQALDAAIDLVRQATSK